MLNCIYNIVLNIVVLPHKKQLRFRKWSRLKCLDPSFSFIIAVSIVTKNSSHDVLNLTEESSVFLELFILHKTFIKCYQITCKRRIIQSISIKIRMNLGTSYILWDYSSTVPYMWLQSTYSAILDPVASLGRLSVFEQCCWAVLSQLPATAKGLFPSRGAAYHGLCWPYYSPPPCHQCLSHAVEHHILADAWSVAQSWLMKHWPHGWGSPSCHRSFGSHGLPWNSRIGWRKWPTVTNSDHKSQTRKNYKILRIRNKKQLRSSSHVQRR